MLYMLMLVLKQVLFFSICVLCDYQGQGIVLKDVFINVCIDGNMFVWLCDCFDGVFGYVLSVIVMYGVLCDDYFVVVSDGMIMLKIIVFFGEMLFILVFGYVLFNDIVCNDCVVCEVLGFFSYCEKYFVGLWCFDIYFGCDMLILVCLLMFVLQLQVVEIGLCLVFEWFLFDGQVVYEEDIGEFVIFDYMKYDGLCFDVFVYDYKMVDSDYLFVLVMQAWLFDDVCGCVCVKVFFVCKFGDVYVGEVLMCNLCYVVV